MRADVPGPVRFRPAAVRRRLTTVEGFELREMVLHGHRIGYRTAGDGPPVVLVHGMLNSSRHWRSVALALAATHTVIAPDLHGHGHSAGPVGDYSIGAHAAGIRDLLSRLGVDRATIVGHSLGGGIAMQFFYQFPERVERLGLVSSGGLGPEVSPLLRAAAAPGVQALLAGATSRPVLGTLGAAARAADHRRPGLATSLRATRRALQGLDTDQARRGFLWTLRSVIDLRGQKVSARDRLRLAGAVPTLVVWGERDHTIPIEHGRHAHEAIPGSRFVALSRAAHFPHLEDPAGLAAALGDWLDETDPADPLDAGRWRALLDAR
jgi:pimeloyl-ACP methyl ester carboxylesterase